MNTRNSMYEKLYNYDFKGKEVVAYYKIISYI